VKVLKAVEQEPRGYSPRTCKAYLHHIKSFMQHCQKTPVKASDDDIRAHDLHAREPKGFSSNYEPLGPNGGGVV